MQRNLTKETGMPSIVKMKKFSVTFQSAGFVNSRETADKIVTNDEYGIEAPFCGGFSDQSTKEGSLPDGVTSVIAGYIKEEEQLCNSIKVLVSICLAIEASDTDDAESFDPPVDLLTKLADVMGTIDDECLLSLDGDWEVEAASILNLSELLSLVGGPKADSAGEPSAFYSGVYNPGVCDNCKESVSSIIGCPDGSEVCQFCFDSGAH